MKLPAGIALLLAGGLVLAAPPPLAAQGYTLHPGDVVLADGRGSTARVLIAPDSGGPLVTAASGSPIVGPTDVIVDRDGAILVSSWAGDGFPENGIYRIDPGDGSVRKLQGSTLADLFQFVRDARGDLVVANGYAGLVRIDSAGNATTFSRPTIRDDVTIGIVLDLDGAFVVTQAPNVFLSHNAPGFVQRVDPVTGLRTTLASSLPFLGYPNGLALDTNGTLLATNAQNYMQPFAHGLARVLRNGTVLSLAAAPPLNFPTDIEVLGGGAYLVTDPGDESVLLLEPGNTVRRVISEFDDGNANNGLPVDRPFGLTVVPRLWLRTPFTAPPRGSVRIEVRGKPFHRVTLAIARKLGPTPLASRFQGDLRTTPLDLTRARLETAASDSTGLAVFPQAVPANLAGQVIYLQAFLRGGGALSNFVALPVR
ncbi:MAG: hypothetical protein ACE5H3_03145 [Planctomycetota bacterium]